MSNDIKNKVSILQLNSYVKPEIEEIRGKDWVLNGKNNSYFEYVEDRFIGSPTNSTILNAYANLIFGRGLMARNANRQPMQYAKMLTAIPKKDLRKVVKQYSKQFNAAFQIITNKNGTKQAKFIDVTKLAFSKIENDDEITGFYYSDDWYNTQKTPPVFYPAYGTTNGKETEILYINDSQDSSSYYSLPKYQSGLQYAEMEEEISNFYISHIQNGFSYGYIVNFNDGVPPDEEQREEIERKIRERMTGSTNAGKVFISFNNGKEAAVEIVPLEVSDSHKQWESINVQCEQKIMRSHGVVSPRLFGINDSAGLGNNADELETALSLTMDMRINPIQDVLIDAITPFLQEQGIVLDLYFEALNKQEEAEEKGMAVTSIDPTTNEVVDVAEEADLLAKETSYNGAQISSALQIVESVKSGILSKEQGFAFLVNMLRLEESVARALTLKDQAIDGSKFLIDLGEVMSDDWELISEERINGVPVEINLASPIDNSPNNASEEDNGLFKVRYVYKGASSPERQFCKDVLNAKLVYRKEDIDKASQSVVQAGMGPNGTNTYNIFLYKGGVNCQHFWQRQIYLRRNNKKISVNEARRRILEIEPSDRADFRLPVNPTKVAQPPNDMKNGGRLS
jgi:hypothetical protein